MTFLDDYLLFWKTEFDFLVREYGFTITEERVGDRYITLAYERDWERIKLYLELITGDLFDVDIIDKNSYLNKRFAFTDFLSLTCPDQKIRKLKFFETTDHYVQDVYHKCAVLMKLYATGLSLHHFITN